MPVGSWLGVAVLGYDRALTPAAPGYCRPKMNPRGRKPLTKETVRGRRRSRATVTGSCGPRLAATGGKMSRPCSGVSSAGTCTRCAARGWPAALDAHSACRAANVRRDEKADRKEEARRSEDGPGDKSKDPDEQKPGPSDPSRATKSGNSLRGTEIRVGWLRCCLGVGSHRARALVP